MIQLLKVTAFNLPRTTRLTGASLALLIGVVHLWVYLHTAAPGYLEGLFLTAAAGSVAAAAGILAGSRSMGWWLGVATGVLGFAGYIASRALGFPGFAEAIGAWHNALGTTALALESSLLALYGSLLHGCNVDSPAKRDWDTYFSAEQ